MVRIKDCQDGQDQGLSGWSGLRIVRIKYCQDGLDQGLPGWSRSRIFKMVKIEDFQDGLGQGELGRQDGEEP